MWLPWKRLNTHVSPLCATVMKSEEVILKKIEENCPRIFFLLLVVAMETIE